jgi:hypothetical protein
VSEAKATVGRAEFVEWAAFFDIKLEKDKEFIEKLRQGK